MSALVARAREGFAWSASALLLVLGLLALLRGRFSGFADTVGTSILWLKANPLLSVIHLLAGLAGIALVARGRVDRCIVALTVGAGALAVIGLALRGGNDIFGRDTGMIVLHLVVAVIGAVLWFAGRRHRAPAAATP
jgi:hypothetical protein